MGPRRRAHGVCAAGEARPFRDSASREVQQGSYSGHLRLQEHLCDDERIVDVMEAAARVERLNSVCIYVVVGCFIGPTRRVEYSGAEDRRDCDS